MPGYNNWIKFDYQNLKCDLDFTSFSPIENKKEAIDFTVNAICSQYNNLYLSMSGGLDSEFAAKSLFERGVKFTPVIVDYKSNSAETWWARKWCYEHKVTPHILEYEEHIFSQQCQIVCKKYNTAFISSIDFIVEEYVSNLDGRLIGPCIDPFLKFNCSSDTFPSTDYNLEFGSYDFMVDYYFPKKHPYSFLTYTPELLINAIENLDYSLPIQFALGKYYGVDIRPKLSAQYNGRNFLYDMSKSNQQLELYVIKIGNKHNVLELSKNNKVLNCLFVSKD